MLNFTPIGVLSVLVYIVIVWFKGKKRAIPVTMQSMRFLFFLYLLAVIAVTLFPIPIDKRLIEDHIKFNINQLNNYIPFRTITQVLQHRYFMVGLKNIAGNTLLLMPLGLFIPLIWGKFSRWGNVFFMGVSCSFAIEFMQFLISWCLGFKYRSFDVDDLLLNTVGFAIGYLSFTIFVKIAPQHLVKQIIVVK